MPRVARFVAGVASFAFVIATSALVRAASGPGCSAAPCPDDDRDGFMACACAPSGVACDCDDADPAAFPGAPEACDSEKDRNCNGTAKEACPARKGCSAGVCVPLCLPLDDFGCAQGSTFGKAADGQTCLCIPRDCSVFGCPPGSTCDDDKKCIASCNASVRCPFGQLCRGAGCVDPCEALACPRGAVCTGGRCVPSCDCPGAVSCTPGQACDRSLDPPRCVETACAGVSCPPGAHCEQGRCVDDCEGVVCPPKLVCRQVPSDGGATRGACVDLCAPNPCNVGFVCDWRTGGCTAVPLPEGGLLGPNAQDLDPLFVVGSGWSCTASGLAHVSFLGAGAAAGAAIAIALRRRRRSPVTSVRGSPAASTRPARTTTDRRTGR